MDGALDDLVKDKLKDNDDKTLEDMKEKSSILTKLKDEICSVQYIKLVCSLFTNAFIVLSKSSFLSQ